MSPRLAFALETAVEAGKLTLAWFQAGAGFELKSDDSPVTAADKAAERRIRERIASAYPSESILGEEEGGTSTANQWVIDPIDGTKSFVLGQLHWGVLIALNDGERPVVGVAYQPFVGEAFVAHADGPAEWRRGDERRPLRTRRCPRLADAIAVTTDPRFFAAPHAAAAFEAVTGPLRFTRYGGDLYCYTQLAMGLSDVVIETGLKPYDIQALVPLIERAGGVVSDWQGRPCYDGGDVLACGDPALHEALLRRIADAR